MFNMKERVMNFVDHITFSSSKEAYKFLDDVQKQMELTNKAASLMYLCTYSVVGGLPEDISAEDCKKYIWKYQDFDEALVFTGKADNFSTWHIWLPECREAKDGDEVL